MSPCIADFRCWERPEVSIVGADQKDRGLWGREWDFVVSVNQGLSPHLGCLKEILLLSRDAYFFWFNDVIETRDVLIDI